MTTKPYPLRIPTGLLELAGLRSHEEHVDKSTALRQLLYMGAEVYLLDLYSKGRVSLLQLAAMLDAPPQRVLDLVELHGLELKDDDALLEVSREAAENLAR